MNCSCCNTVITKDDPSINCSVCDKIFNATCTEATRSDLKRFGPSTGISWSCKSCRGLDLRSLILTLQEEIKNLKSTVLAPVVSTTENLIKSEEIIQEVLERERRRKNIIVYGITESKSTNKSERIAADVTTVSDVFRSIGVRVPDDIKLIRLSKFDPTKAVSKRPIKICFQSSDIAPAILKKAKLLKGSTEYTGVFISADRTPTQQKLFNAVKTELTERKSKGEVNLRIKYMNGVPKIVLSEN